MPRGKKRARFLMNPTVAVDVNPPKHESMQTGLSMTKLTFASSNSGELLSNPSTLTLHS